MKRILLLLSLLLAPSAFADDAVTSFGWNSVTGTFQGLTRVLGWKSLPDYEQGSFPVTFTGAHAASVTMNYFRVGKIVFLQAAQNIGLTSCSAASFNAASGTLPASIRPAGAQIPTGVMVQNNSAATGGAIEIDTSGSMELGPAVQSLTFSTSGTCGYYGFTVPYSLN